MRSFWRRLRRKLRALRKLSWSDRALAVESIAMLAAARILVKTAPQKRLVQRLGGTNDDATRIDDAESTSALPAANNPPNVTGTNATGARVGRMLERAARITFWRSMCLEKALAGKWMLRRRGIPSTIYVGMARQGEAFAAHAWLVGEGHTLTGAGKTVYATLAAFREPGQSAARSRNTL